MQHFAFAGNGAGLRPELKRDWEEGQLAQDMLFIHGGAPLNSVKNGGIDPNYAQEYLTHANGEFQGQPIAGGKMIFAFQVVAGNDLPANASKPAAVGQLWGFDGDAYVFLAPQGTKFWCQDGVVAHGREVAFPYVIEQADLRYYWAPSKNFVTPHGQAPNPRRNFQKVPWQAVMANRQ